ncbi:MAG: polyprenyl diphosphate synthase [Candidatus Pacebacteria bacterium]|nr:polyprenyl diphosphate synthase [Candidatus Paceibacterota bacterium]
MPSKKNLNHLGIILDGNRRWAREKGMPKFVGHKIGLEKIKDVANWCNERKIKILTLFVFSTENWNREKQEINYLMRLIQKAIADNLEELHKKGIRIRVIGQKDRLPKFVQESIKKAEDLTEKNLGMVLNFALSYGGRAEIVSAIKNIVEKKIPLDKINEETIKENLWTSDVDLVIRTGKEMRISNFLIWQAAYSELYFLPKYWPDFSEKDLDNAISEYNLRQRRFGK